MKFKSFLVLGFLAISLTLNSCYQDVITAVEKTNLQIGLNYSKFYNSLNFVYNDTLFHSTQNVNNYYDDGAKLYSNSQFQSNIDKVEKIELYQASMWIDSMSNYTSDSLAKFDSTITYIKFLNDKNLYVINKYIKPNIGNFYSKDSLLYFPKVFTIAQDVNDSIALRFKEQRPFKFYTYVYNYKGKNKYYQNVNLQFAASIRMSVKN